MNIYQNKTSKPIQSFVNDLVVSARKNDFVIHNEDNMEMAHALGRHDVEVAEEFDLHLIQICKPEKAASSLSQDSERSVLMPKFIITFSREGMTQVRFIHYKPETVRALVDDQNFTKSLAESFAQIIAVIEAAV